MSLVEFLFGVNYIYVFMFSFGFILTALASFYYFVVKQQKLSFDYDFDGTVLELSSLIIVRDCIFLGIFFFIMPFIIMIFNFKTRIPFLVICFLGFLFIFIHLESILLRRYFKENIIQFVVGSILLIVLVVSLFKGEFNIINSSKYIEILQETDVLYSIEKKKILDVKLLEDIEIGKSIADKSEQNFRISIGEFMNNKYGNYQAYVYTNYNNNLYIYIKTATEDIVFNTDNERDTMILYEKLYKEILVPKY